MNTFKNALLLFVAGWLVGCAPEPRTVNVVPQRKPQKIITRNVEVQFSDGRKVTLARQEVDVEDFASRLNSVSIGQLDKIPRPLSMPSPKFPASLMNKGVQGSAEVCIMVDEKGVAEKIHVTKASEKEFGDAAVAAVLNWRFEPMTVKGKPTKVEFIQKFFFQQ